MFHLYNTFLNLFNISSLFAGGIIISSAGFCLSILSSFEFFYMHNYIFTLRFTQNIDKKTQTNKITQSSDTNIPESAGEHKK